MTVHSVILLDKCTWKLNYGEYALDHTRPFSCGDEYRTSPLGVDISRPRLNWVLRSKVPIPANTIATVLIPVRNPADVRESGKPVVKSRGVRYARMEEGQTAVFEVGYGIYRFTSDGFEAIHSV